LSNTIFCLVLGNLASVSQDIWISACHGGFNSTDLKDIEYIYSMYYNKLEIIRVSSSVGKYVGYTELGVKNAERLNKDPSLLAQMRNEKESYCQHNIQIHYDNILTKSGELPYVRLHSTTPSAGPHPAMLVCRCWFVLKQVWREDLLCGGARQPGRASGH
uniref:MHC class II beta chain N-terminal domain-containing protein n=1 Tax=Monopterus albus TaxID=43700 RepID=A0A3Q3IIW3_MONAL